MILSQIVRGAAEVLAGPGDVDSRLAARAFRGASDAAYRAVRKPVEGTMLTVIRSLAEAAERKAAPGARAWTSCCRSSSSRARRRWRARPRCSTVLREAGVVDAGGAGLVELLRGITAAVRGEPLPEAPVEAELSVDAVHQELSEFRYCTVFVVEGAGLDADGLEQSSSGSATRSSSSATTPRSRCTSTRTIPGAALSLGVAQGTIDRIEIANMHAQTVAREERLAEDQALPDEGKTTEVVAVVAGEGNRRLFASLGAGRIIEGGQTMNPSTQDILDAIEAAPAPEVVVLPNNSNVVMSAEQAARLATKPVRVVRTESIPAGLAAIVVYDSGRSAEANVGEMHEALEALATGAVTVASRDAEVDGVAVREGEFLGLVDDRAVAAGGSFDEVAQAVLVLLLAEPRDLLTLLTGAEAPGLNGLRAWVGEQHPDLEVEVQDGGQPHYPLLISAE